LLSIGLAADKGYASDRLPIDTSSVWK
ncbi:nitroreductase family protein, partial [Bacillus atrophaeus]|nr:nitroreductase family protein [Bacillus atrophaeus]